MGLFGSNKESDKLNPAKKITKSKGEEILSYLNPKDKKKVKEYVKELDSKGKSYKELYDRIKEDHGSEMKRKFIHAAKKYEGGGLTLKEKRRNIATQRRSEGGTGYRSSSAMFAGGEVQSRHRVSFLGRSEDEDSGGEGRLSTGRFSQKKGSQVGINSSKKGSASARSDISSASSSKKPSGKGGGTRPLGF
jgi:hypothetical protein